MGINMDFKNKPEYKFINLEGLDEKAQSEIKAILKSEIASDVLKLPWNNGDNNNYVTNHSVTTELSEEVPSQWHQHYEDGATMYEVTETQTPLLASNLSRTMAAVPHSYMVPYQEWPMNNPYTTPSTNDPNAYQYLSYGNPIYHQQPQQQQQQQQQQTEVMRLPRDGGDRRRGGSNRQHKNDYNHRMVNTNDMQQTYIQQAIQGQYNTVTGLCHTAGGLPFIRYSVAQTPGHSVAGRPVFMTTQFNQPTVYTNNHPQYTYPTLQHHSPTNTKQHQRPQSQHYYNNQEQVKNHSNVPKSERKYHEINQSTRINNNANINNNDFMKKKYSKGGPANGHAVPKNSTNEFKSFEKIEKIQNDDSNVVVVKNICTVEEKVDDVVEKKVVDNVVERKNECEMNHDVVTVVGGGGDVVVGDGNVEKIEEGKIEPEIEEKIVEEAEDLTVLPAVSEVTSDVPVVTVSTPAPPAAPPVFSFASIVKKKTNDQPIGTERQVLRPTIVETSELPDNTNQVEATKRQNRSGTFENNSSTIVKEQIESTVMNNCIKPSNDLQSLNDPNVYRMGEFLLNYQMDKQTVSLQPRGLTNRSNYCYINSILQALLACPPFYNLLTALPRNKTPLKNSPTPLIDNMIKFVSEFTQLPLGARLPRKDLRAQKRSEDIAIEIQGGTAFEPSFVYTMLKNTACSSVFSIEGRQEDAEEFLSCLLNGISDEMLELMKQVSDDQANSTPAPVEAPVNLNNSADEEWKVMGPRNKGSITRCTEIGRTPLSDIFRGQLRSRIHRQGDQYSDNVQPFFTLQLDIEKAESVEGALEILVGKDQVEGMLCSKTKQQIQAWKQVTLEELPVILILHLKWFNYKLDGCSKIFKNVSYAIDLKIDSKILTSNVAKKLTGKQKQYKLFAVTYHDGKEATKGHYVTDAFHVSYGAWVRYDDSSVKGVSEHDVLNPSTPRVPYLLYYRRCDTIGNQPTTIRSR